MRQNLMPTPPPPSPSPGLIQQPTLTGIGLGGGNAAPANILTGVSTTYAQPAVAQAPQLVGVSTSSRGRMILLVGPPGIGKTTFAAQFTPGATYWVMGPKEAGIIDLMDSGVVRVDPSMIHPFITDFPALQYLFVQITNRTSTIPQNVRTIVIESVTEFELMARTHCCQVDYKSDWSAKGFMNFQDGYRQTANGYWSPFIGQLCRLRELGYNIVLTGHSTVQKQKNKSGVDYLAETCSCDYRVWDVTHPFFENVFFLSYDVEAERGDKKDNIAMGTGKAKGFTRMLYVNQTPYQNAKNRCGLTQDIEAECTAPELYRRWCTASRLDPMTLRYLPR